MRDTDYGMHVCMEVHVHRVCIGICMRTHMYGAHGMCVGDDLQESCASLQPGLAMFVHT